MIDAVYSAAPPRSICSGRVATQSASPSIAKVVATTTRAAAVGASRPTLPANSSSDRPVSSSFRVVRAVRPIAIIGIAKEMIEANSFIMSPPKVSSPATRPLSITIASPSELP